MNTTYHNLIDGINNWYLTLSWIRSLQIKRSLVSYSFVACLTLDSMFSLWGRWKFQRSINSLFGKLSTKEITLLIDFQETAFSSWIMLLHSLLIWSIRNYFLDMFGFQLARHKDTDDQWVSSPYVVSQEGSCGMLEFVLYYGVFDGIGTGYLAPS